MTLLATRPPFGLSADLAAPLQPSCAGEAFMALELLPGALEGVIGEGEVSAAV